MNLLCFLSMLKAGMKLSLAATIGIDFDLILLLLNLIV